MQPWPKDLIPVTEGLVRIAETCTLCGICDLQCTSLPACGPMVMRALKDWVGDFLKRGGKPGLSRTRRASAAPPGNRRGRLGDERSGRPSHLRQRPFPAGEHENAPVRGPAGQPG